MPAGAEVSVNPCSTPRRSLMYHSVKAPRRYSTRLSRTTGSASGTGRRSPRLPTPTRRMPQYHGGSSRPLFGATLGPWVSKDTLRAWARLGATQAGSPSWSGEAADQVSWYSASWMAARMPSHSARDRPAVGLSAVASAGAGPGGRPIASRQNTAPTMTSNRALRPSFTGTVPPPARTHPLCALDQSAIECPGCPVLLGA